MSIGKVSLDFRADGIATPVAPFLYTADENVIVVQSGSLFDYRVNSATREQKRAKATVNRKPKMIP